MPDRPAIRVLLLFAAAVLALPGCSSAVKMMPAPLAIRQAGADPFATVSPVNRTTSIEVLYATNRAPSGSSSHRARYGSGRSETVRVGSASVRFGPEHWAWEDLADSTAGGERPAISVTRVQEFGVFRNTDGTGDDDAGLARAGPAASMSAEGLPTSAQTRFAETINDRLRHCADQDVFIYVPGFNLTFELGLRRMAEFSHYLGRDGVFVTYAWPAHSHPFAYGTDRRNAHESVAGFRDFLRFLVDHTGAEKIHLITSSAGAPVVSQTLLLMHEEHAGLSGSELRQRTRIGEVIYAASDEGTAEFREMMASGAAETAEHFTVYASSVDIGLVLTKLFGSGDTTIGRYPAHLTDADADLLRRHADRVTVVDVTNAIGPAGRGDIWAHRYWYLNTWVSSDLLGVLRHRLSPSRRGLTLSDDGAIWEFPPDYESRMREQLEDCALGQPTPGAPTSEATTP